MNAFKNLFFDQLAEMYSSELQIAKALPHIIHAINSERLQNDLQADLRETMGHVSKAAQVFNSFSEEPVSGHHDGVIASLLNEADAMISDFGSSSAIDAGIIASMQKVEHFEMATYGCLRDWARLLGNTKAECLLQEILEEEKLSDLRLTEEAHLRNIGALDEAVGARLAEHRPR